jgi:DNA-binding transcriptional MerR regulator
MQTDARNSSQPMAQHADFSLERISRLVSDLEQELAKAPPGSPRLDALREEIEELKHTLSNNGQTDKTIEQLHGMRKSLSEFAASVEGEVMKDTPYLTELGRILGFI